ncbi:unnamed protein product [Soboliphyme baturini]|uniref:Secreted protein n=1 Tax=Soboliphyme baturini TaxID=241478 RepID=A0A183J039_9BILA|nr:unnamed protein product [Soboliphyme baturini]
MPPWRSILSSHSTDVSKRLIVLSSGLVALTSAKGTRNSLVQERLTCSFPFWPSSDVTSAMSYANGGGSRAGVRLCGAID